MENLNKNFFFHMVTFLVGCFLEFLTTFLSDSPNVMSAFIKNKRVSRTIFNRYSCRCEAFKFVSRMSIDV